MKRAASLFAAAVLLAGCGGTPQAASPSSSAAPLRIANNHNATLSAFGWVTNDDGIFAKHGVAVDMQAVDPSIGSKMLAAGQLDAAILPSTQALNIKASGAPITLVAVFNEGDQLLMVPNDITSPEQIRGKVVGVTSRQAANSGVVIRALRSYGLEPDRDYQLLQTGEGAGYPGLMAQLQVHHIDAAAMDPQLAGEITSQGEFHSIMDLGQSGFSTAGLTLVFLTDYLKQHHDVAQKTVDSLIDGVHFARDHRAETEDVLRKDYSISDQDKLDGNYDLQIKNWRQSPLPSKNDFLDLVDSLAKDNPAVKDIDLDAFIDPSLVQDAVKRGLTSY